MTRLTFRVCASSFAAKMDMRKNALNHQEAHPEAVNAALEAFFVDDGLVGTNSVDGAFKLLEELQCLFSLGGFKIRKWKASHRIVEPSIPQHLRDQQSTSLNTYSEEFVKVLRVERGTVPSRTPSGQWFQQPASPEDSPNSD